MPMVRRATNIQTRERRSSGGIRIAEVRFTTARFGVKIDLWKMLRGEIVRLKFTLTHARLLTIEARSGETEK